jgi:translation initiation factor IF-3
MQLVQKVRDDLSGMSQVEMDPKITGRNITMTLAPLPANRRKRKFTAEPKTPEEGDNSAEPVSTES